MIENGFEMILSNKSANVGASVNFANRLFSHFANYFVSMTSILKTYTSPDIMKQLSLSTEEPYTSVCNPRSTGTNSNSIPNLTKLPS